MPAKSETVPAPLDAEELVYHYRDMVMCRDAATTSVDRSEFDGVAQKMKIAWKNSQGKDNLHEMAFGVSGAQDALGRGIDQGSQSG